MQYIHPDSIFEPHTIQFTIIVYDKHYGNHSSIQVSNNQGVKIQDKAVLEMSCIRDIFLVLPVGCQMVFANTGFTGCTSQGVGFRAILSDSTVTFQHAQS